MLKHLLHCLTALEPAPLSDQDCRNVARMAEYRAKRGRFDMLVMQMERAVEHALRDIHDEALVEAAVAAGRRAMERHPNDHDLVELGLQAAMMRARGPGGDAA